jgi:hypothetical protein
MHHVPVDVIYSVAYLQLKTIKKFWHDVFQSCDTQHESNTLAYDLNYILFLDYKLPLPNYINNMRFIGLEVCAVGEQDMWVLPATSCFSFMNLMLLM